jgi:hypothetical protein
VASWSVDGLHDFRAAGTAIEVKTTVGGQHSFKISHVDQLDTKGIDALVLARIRLLEGTQGATLGELVGRLRAKLATDFPNSAEEFDEKLIRGGYLDVDADMYARRFELQEAYGYLVSESFPRLTRSNIPPAITDAIYTLDEAQLGAFRIDREKFESAFCRLGVQDE